MTKKRSAPARSEATTGALCRGPTKPETPAAVDAVLGDDNHGSANRVGEVSFHPAHQMPRGPASGLGPRREIIVELKDVRAERLEHTPGLPSAFPRPGAKKMLDNERVVAWDYTWTPGRPTPVHFHDKDIIVVYLADGVISSVTTDGRSVDNTHSFGVARFNPGSRVHYEKLASVEARAIVIELK